VKPFRFKKFEVDHDNCCMKVNTDGVLLGAWVDIQKDDSVLDIGTGSGVIALMIAQRAALKIDAVEIDSDSAQQAGENFRKSSWSKKLSVFHDSFQKFYKNANFQLYDHIVTNPPFFADGIKPQSQKRFSARSSENLSIEELLFGVNKIIAPNGTFSAVYPPNEGEILIEKAESYGFKLKRKCNIIGKIGKGEVRVLLSLQKGFSGNIDISSLTVRSGDNSFTKEYEFFTNDYYLWGSNSK